MHDWRAVRVLEPDDFEHQEGERDADASQLRSRQRSGESVGQREREDFLLKRARKHDSIKLHPGGREEHGLGGALARRQRGYGVRNDVLPRNDAQPSVQSPKCLSPPPKIIKDRGVNHDEYPEVFLPEAENEEEHEPHHCDERLLDKTKPRSQVVRLSGKILTE